MSNIIGADKRLQLESAFYESSHCTLPSMCCDLYPDASSPLHENKSQWDDRCGFGEGTGLRIITDLLFVGGIWVEGTSYSECGLE